MPKAIKISKRADAQRDRLLDAAEDIFLQNGFGITTVDSIAAHAKASKWTLYSYFGSKENIFIATMERLCERALAPLHKLAVECDDPETLLIEFGIQLLTGMLSPEGIAIHRVVVSEAIRFPDLAKLFYQIPAKVQRILSERLSALKIAGKLQIDDPHFIAGLFIQMILGEAQQKAMLAISPAPTVEDARRHSAAVSKLLLYAIGGPAHHPSSNPPIAIKGESLMKRSRFSEEPSKAGIIRPA